MNLLQEVEHSKLVEEDHANSHWSHITEGEGQQAVIAHTECAIVAQLIVVKLPVEHPSGKDADEHTTNRQEHHAREVVEEFEYIASEECDGTERTKRKRAQDAKHHYR